MHEEADHEFGEAIGVAVPPIGCGSAAPPVTVVIRVLSKLMLYNFLIIQIILQVFFYLPCVQFLILDLFSYV